MGSGEFWSFYGLIKKHIFFLNVFTDFIKNKSTKLISFLLPLFPLLVLFIFYSYRSGKKRQLINYPVSIIQEQYRWPSPYSGTNSLSLAFPVWPLTNIKHVTLLDLCRVFSILTYHFLETNFFLITFTCFALLWELKKPSLPNKSARRDRVPMKTVYPHQGNS